MQVAAVQPVFRLRAVTFEGVAINTSSEDKNNRLKDLSYTRAETLRGQF